MHRHCKRPRGLALEAIAGGLVLLALASLASGSLAEAPAATEGEKIQEVGPNGFQLSNLRVPRDEIRAGGPPRDAIRSVDAPSFASVEAARWVRGGNPVIGVARGGAAHAYPVHVMERHQVVNDVLGKTPIVATYDPLAGSPRVYERRLDERVLEFGVAGLLYNANFLLYDRQTESLWVQFTGEAIAGPLAGRRLRALRSHQEPIAGWARREPATRVMTLPEPERIDYRHSPFKRYWIQNRLPAPVKADDPRFHAKELVLGVVAGGEARAYLGSLLTAAGGGLSDAIDGNAVEIVYDSETASFRFDAPASLDVREAYWFAWKAFYPETRVWNDPGSLPPLTRD